MLSLANLTVADAGPLGLLAAAGDAGFDAVNMWLVPPPAMATMSLKCGATAPVVGNPSLIREIKGRVATTGVQVFQASCGWLSADFDRGATTAVLDALAEIGAGRLVLVGWDPDPGRLRANIALVCEDAAAYGITVTLEFMPYSAVRSVADAAKVLAEVGAPNLDVLVDALHLARSGGTPADLSVLDSRQIGAVQLCDAPAQAPSAELLRDESVNRRRYPGDGELPLRDLLEALPPNITIEIEAPSSEHALLSIADRARACARRTRLYLEATRD